MKYFQRARKTSVPKNAPKSPSRAIAEQNTNAQTKQQSTATDPQSAAAAPETPDKRQELLTEEDEAFLKKIASNADAPLPPSELDSADEHIPSSAFLTQLPSSPPEERGNAFEDTPPARSRRSWNLGSFVPSSPFSRKRKYEDQPESDKGRTIDNEKPAKATDEEEVREARDVSTILSNLNLATLNNRVISLSDDSKKLVHQFNQILRDIITGVPTAYDDLEKFLTQRQGQIEKLYKSMPPFIQALIVALPGKMLSATGSKQSTSSQATSDANKQRPASKRKQATSYIPTLRNLVAQKGAIAGMLQSTITFLETRFPAVLVGTNVFMSLAVFILMFVFWYCHKRGKEVRLAKEGEMEEVTNENPEVPDTASHSPEEPQVRTKTKV